MERFLKYCNQSSDDICWIWSGPIDSKDGYGCLKIDGVLYKAHRLAFQYAYGYLPELVSHKCYEFTGTTQKLCVNPIHLSDDSKQGNRRDQIRFREDRQMKISPEQVDELRREFAISTLPRLEFFRQMGKKYGITARYAEGICYKLDRQIKYSL